MKIQTKLAHFLISSSRTQARVWDVSKKLHVMKLACLLVLSRSRPRWGGREKNDVKANYVWLNPLGAKQPTISSPGRAIFFF
jgi:hypothetical protein